jgi:hypothetical protein
VQSGWAAAQRDNPAEPHRVRVALGELREPAAQVGDLFVESQPRHLLERGLHQHLPGPRAFTRR